ncbi:hypothetical protein THAOC_05901, partial [Thalassiosira oceanica]
MAPQGRGELLLNHEPPLNVGGILSGRAGRDNFLRDWNRVKRSPLGVLEQRGIPAKIEAKIEFFDNPLADENLAVETPPTPPSSTPQCLLVPPSPIPSSSGDPCGPSYLQIGSLGQCLPIGHAAGAQNVEHPRGDHGAAGTCHACPEGGSASGKTTWEPTPTSTLLAYTLALMHLPAFHIPRASRKTTWEPVSTSTSTAAP